MEIEVIVDASPLMEEEKGKYQAVSAFFYFISLDKYNRAIPIPPLKVGTIQAVHSGALLKPECWIYLIFHIISCPNSDYIH